MNCRFINTSGNDAYINMAIDESILSCCDKPTLRVYQWSIPSISIGYNQSVIKELNLEECKKSSTPIVRRITGGRAIFHDKELTYSFIVPENTIKMPKEVTESYKIIANALLTAFQKIGLKAEMNRQAERISTPNCFNSFNWYEITVKGKKLCGSAQKRLNGKILQHGSLLIDFDYEKNALLFRQNRNGALESLKKKVTSIKKELNRKISYSRLADAVKYGFGKNFNIDFFDDSLTEKELSMAELLKNEKYSAGKWNFRI